MALSCSGWRPFRYFDHRALIHWMYRELCQCFKYKYKKSLYLHMRCAVVELCLTQRANPNLSGSKPKSCTTGQPYGTGRSVGPVRGGLGYRWLVTPTEPYPSRRSGLDYLGSNSCTIFINYLDVKNIYKTQNYIKIAIFFLFSSFSFFLYLHVLRQFLIDI